MKEQTYRSRLAELLNNTSICKENRELFKEFFKWEEYKLLRTNGLSKLDEGTITTLYGFIDKLINMNNWFGNKPLKDITKDDIKRIYDDLEDGTILNSRGKPFKDKRSYYNKIFKSKLFQMIHKSDLAKEVLEYSTKPKDNDVRFVREETIRQLVDVMVNPRHKALAWLSFDVGENINSMLKLKKSDCVRQINEQTKDAEYRINFDPSILKRSRTARSEITNYPETTQFFDIILRDLKDDDLVFPFKYSMAKKFLHRAVRITKAECIPKGQPVTWKDFRSSMACDLLNKGLTTDEINQRLGHKPSSSQIDKYVTFLAMDRHKPKKKIYDNTITKLNEQLNEMKEREKMQFRRIETMQKRMDDFEKASRIIELYEKQNIKK